MNLAEYLEECKLLITKKTTMTPQSYVHYWDLSDNNVLEISYDFWKEPTTHLDEGGDFIEIHKIILNGDDMTDKLDVFYDEIEDDIKERGSHL
jgi:hypothetical protein|tara:strand:- start:362 stop:640 length:279 start_codon:yes stop_codon:yes gene_type:complete